MAFIKRLYGEYTLILLVLVLGIVISGWLASSHQRDLQRDVIESFHAAAQDRIKLIDEKIQHNAIVLRMLSAFFRSSENITRTDFTTYTRQLLKDYPYIHTIEWIPHVLQEERMLFEQSIQNSITGFIITEMSGNETLTPAGMKTEYFPILYAEPFINGNQEIIGIDITSNPERKLAVERALETRQVSATRGVSLLQINDENKTGVVFYEPVVKTIAGGDQTQKTYERVIGLIGSVVPLDDMLDKALEPLSYQGVNIVIHDLSAGNSDQKLLYAKSTRLKNIAQDEIIADYLKDSGLREKTVIDVGGRQWEITVLPARGYFQQTISNDSYFIFAAGLAISLLLVFYMLSRANENKRIMEEVDIRTEQLNKAKREIETILYSTHEGIIGLDENGLITFFNVTAKQILGYRKKELIDKNHHVLFYKDGSEQGDVTEGSPITKVLEYGQPCNIRGEVFWHKNGTSIPVDYSGSPIIENGEIKGAVLIFRDVTEQRKLEKQLEHLARYDQLTGIANRNMFVEYFKTSLSRAERQHKKAALIYMDLNGFKPVNDTLGHAAGDLVLKKFAQILKEIVRDTDLPARVGGDEFVILVDSLDHEEQSLILVERLKKRLEKPFDIDGHKFNIGASVGISHYPAHSKDYEELITFADQAMYKAKSDKSLPYVIYTPEEQVAEE